MIKWFSIRNFTLQLSRNECEISLNLVALELYENASVDFLINHTVLTLQLNRCFRIKFFFAGQRSQKCLQISENVIEKKCYIQIHIPQLFSVDRLSTVDIVLSLEPQKLQSQIPIIQARKLSPLNI